MILLPVPVRYEKLQGFGAAVANGKALPCGGVNDRR